MDLKEEIIAKIRSAIEAAPNADLDDARTRFLFVDIGELDLAEISDAIIQAITTRLTSEEAVEAFHATFERFGQLGALKCQRISDDHARTCIQAAIGRATRFPSMACTSTRSRPEPRRRNTVSSPTSGPSA